MDIKVKQIKEFNIVNPSNGDVLEFNTSSGKWENKTKPVDQIDFQIETVEDGVVNISPYNFTRREISDIVIYTDDGTCTIEIINDGANVTFPTSPSGSISIDDSVLTRKIVKE